MVDLTDRCEQAIRDRVAELNPFSVNVYREGAIAVLEAADVAGLRAVLAEAYQWMNDYPAVGTYGVIPLMRKISGVLRHTDSTA